MDIRQFDAGIGVEVRNVDVCDPDDRLFDELQTLFDTETLLVFRDERLTYEQGQQPLRSVRPARRRYPHRHERGRDGPR